MKTMKEKYAQVQRNDSPIADLGEDIDASSFENSFDLFEPEEENDFGAVPFNVRSGKVELPKFKPILRYSKNSVGQADPS